MNMEEENKIANKNTENKSQKNGCFKTGCIIVVVIIAGIIVLGNLGKAVTKLLVKDDMEKLKPSLEEYSGNKSQINNEPTDINSDSDMDILKEVKLLNAQLPMRVDDITMFTKADYDSAKKILTYVYKYTVEMEEEIFTEDLINAGKMEILTSEITKNDIKRQIEQGLSVHFVYNTCDNRKLYEYTIDKSDLPYIK